MSNVYIEWRENKGKYVVLQNKQEITSGSTQAEAIQRACAARSNDPILVERVRDTKVGSRDKWRRVCC